MTLALLSLILLAVLVAAIGAWRKSGASAEELRRLLEDQQARSRQDQATALQPLLAQLGQLQRDLAVAKADQMKAQAEELGLRFQELRSVLQGEIREARKEQGEQLRGVQTQVHDRLEAIRKDNEARLEKMRQTVDEKLHATLEKRLGESFSLVAQRLEEVQKGLGEMQNLAQDVGGLKRALTNVKTRGVLGEAQLGALLEQYLAPGQYEANVKPKPRSGEVVEYAVKLPGPEDGRTVWLPIDAKFPIEDYQRLVEAYETGDREALEAAGKALEARILAQARDIRDKYIAAPHTTDFALLFLPFEGLYAEALRRPGLFQRVQQECKVTFVGPTTLTAFLNSLQVGFKTLAISKQSAEVWKILGKVRTEFGRFGDALEAVQKKLDEAGTKLEEVAKRRNLMEKALVKVERAPEGIEEEPVAELAARAE